MCSHKLTVYCWVEKTYMLYVKYFCVCYYVFSDQQYTVCWWLDISINLKIDLNC